MTGGLYPPWSDAARVPAGCRLERMGAGKLLVQGDAEAGSAREWDMGAGSSRLLGADVEEALFTT